MKRTLTYILVFFGICYLLGSISERMTQNIYFSYAPNVVNELKDRINQNEILYLDGQMLQAYIISSGDAEVCLDNSYVNSVMNKYKVTKKDGQLSISLTNKNKTSLSTIKSLDRIILIKNIAINIIGIVVAIDMYIIYNSHKKNNINTFKIAKEPV